MQYEYQPASYSEMVSELVQPPGLEDERLEIEQVISEVEQEVGGSFIEGLE